MEAPPQEFRVRFIASRVLAFVPAATAILVIAIGAETRYLPLFCIKYVLLLAFVGWLANRGTVQEWQSIQEDAKLDLEFAKDRIRRDGRSHILPILGAVTVLGVIHSLARKDWRWMILVGGLGVLLLLGWSLRWVVYHRWAASAVR